MTGGDVTMKHDKEVGYLTKKQYQEEVTGVRVMIGSS
jgi:hypothetical protein